MVKYKGMSFVAVPRLDQNSCRGCHWYPTSLTLFRESLPNRQQSIESYLEEGCLKIHEGNKRTLCQDLNIIFVKQ